MIPDIKSDDAERAQRNSLSERAGEGASPAAGTEAQPSEELPAMSRPSACVKGERGHTLFPLHGGGYVNRSGTANRVCSSPGGRRFLIALVFAAQRRNEKKESFHHEEDDFRRAAHHVAELL